MTLHEYLSSLRGKRIAVVGIGVSNKPLLRLLLEVGCSVTACDRSSREKLGDTADWLEALGCTLHLGESYLDDTDFDMVFRTPGLHPRFLSAFAERGAVLTSEMEAFFSLCPCEILAVTGSDGKTTTSTVTAELLKKQGYRVWLGGNIGTPLLDRLPEMKSTDKVVLELSSFQHHSMNCHPHRALITNLAPNHLDVHPDMEDYIDAKKKIFARQSGDDLLVVNADNDITAPLRSGGQTRFFSRRHEVDGSFCLGTSLYRSGRYLMDVSEIRIPGWHNAENFMAAFTLTEGLVSDEVCAALAREFPGVEHRLEHIRTLRGVDYCNDSIASSPSRTIAGLEAVRQRPILIAGGYDKHIPFDTLGDEVCRRCKALVLTGHTAEAIEAAVRASPLYDSAALPILREDDFEKAVLAAAGMATEGDLVLLSPACASFDRFKNFAERGNTFRSIVEKLS